MAFNSEITFSAETSAEAIGLASEQVTFSKRRTTSFDYLKGLIRATVAAARPSVTIALFREIDARDRVLSRLGWALMFVVPLFATLAFLLPGAGGANPWVKPIKFSLSFSTFVSTISLFLLALRIPEWQLKLARWVIAASVALEIFSQAGQAWRLANSPVAQSLVDTGLQQMTTGMVVINTTVVIWMFVLFCANRVHTRLVDAPMVSAIRYSIAIFLAGNAVGGYMLARGSHTVGAPDGGAGIPFVNWSAIAGDLRIAHFIAIHSIQIIPIFAYLLWKMAPQPAIKQRKLAIAGLAVVVTLVVGLTFFQAMMGRPLFPHF